MMDALNFLLNQYNEAVCRSAPDTPGLIINPYTPVTVLILGLAKQPYSKSADQTADKITRSNKQVFGFLG